jgi:hypothetical protein
VSKNIHISDLLKGVTRRVIGVSPGTRRSSAPPCANEQVWRGHCPLCKYNVHSFVLYRSRSRPNVMTPIGSMIAATIEYEPRTLSFHYKCKTVRLLVNTSAPSAPSYCLHRRLQLTCYFEVHIVRSHELQKGKLFVHCLYIRSDGIWLAFLVCTNSPLWTPGSMPLWRLDECMKPSYLGYSLRGMCSLILKQHRRLTVWRLRADLFQTGPIEITFTVDSSFHWPMKRIQMERHIHGMWYYCPPYPFPFNKKIW